MRKRTHSGRARCPGSLGTSGTRTSERRQGDGVPLPVGRRNSIDAHVPGWRVGGALGQSRAACSSPLYVAVRRLLELVVLGRRSETDKDLEIVVLRHELAVFRRQVKRPVFRVSDRAFLAAAGRALSRKRWGVFLVGPETLLQCHRRFVARKWSDRTRPADGTEEIAAGSACPNGTPMLASITSQAAPRADPRRVRESPQTPAVRTPGVQAVRRAFRDLEHTLSGRPRPRAPEGSSAFRRSG